MEFAGSIGQYAGKRLLLWREGGAYELRAGRDLVGRLTRPDEAYLGETRDGSWRLWHKHRTAPKVLVTDAASGAEAARYRRRPLRTGGRIVTAQQNTYHLRKKQLTDASGNDVFTMDYDIEENGLLAITPVAADSDELPMLAMVCSYIALLENVPVPMTTAAPPAS